MLNKASAYATEASRELAASEGAVSPEWAAQATARAAVWAQLALAAAVEQQGSGLADVPVYSGSADDGR